MDEDKIQSKDKDVKVLRTYTSDMADEIRKNEMSVIKIALAEKEKREQEDLYKRAEGTKLSKVLLILGGIIFIGAAIFGSYLLFKNKKTEIIPQTSTNIDTFISYDANSKIDTTTISNPSDLINLIQKEQTSSNFIKALFLTKKINGISELLTARNFLSLIQTTSPDALIRSLSDRYLLGKYLIRENTTNKNESSVFLIFETTNYPQAYASMLEWEKTMLEDLFVLFNIDVAESNNSLFEKQWKDIIVNNKDARVLYGENGEDLLYYLFVNKSHFIITNNIDTLKEVMARLITKNAQPL